VPPVREVDGQVTITGPGQRGSSHVAGQSRYSVVKRDLEAIPAAAWETGQAVVGRCAKLRVAPHCGCSGWSCRGQHCSVCCRWPPVYELTVWCTLLPFVGAGGSAATDRYQGMADVAAIRRNLRRICDTLQR